MIIGNDGADREQPNPGLVRGVCIGIVDIGWQAGFQGAVQKQVLYLWEIDQRLSKGEHAGKRHLVSRKYKQSMHEKAGHALMLEAWNGRRFTEDERKGHDTDQYLDRPCMINLQLSKDAKFVNVGDVLPMPSGMEPLKREAPAGYLPEWVKKKIEEGKSKPAVEGQHELTQSVENWTPEMETQVDPLEAKKANLKARSEALWKSGAFNNFQLSVMQKKLYEHKGALPSQEHLIKEWEAEAKAFNAKLSEAGDAAAAIT